LPAARIIHLTETASTNADAMRLALAGEELPLWVSARRQTSGRGRAGRTWVSGDGNLQASVAVHCTKPLIQAGQLSLVAGVALVDAVHEVAPNARGLGLRLKWPNDVLFGAAKAGGILVESAAMGSPPGFLAVVGFGLNVANSPPDLRRAVTSLAQQEIAVNVESVFTSLCGAMDRWLKVWNSPQGFDAVRAAWLHFTGPLGETITVHGAAGPVSGTFQGLNCDGALLVSIDGRLQTVTYGDVSIKEPKSDLGNG
jgi:BirA family transcriptional regulator, biotin operon repressor / biotin---[acetyl-CoA-carboxylase] ligase